MIEPIIKSLPERKKDSEIITTGYNSEDFGRNYWLARNIKGNRRIDRDAFSLRQYVVSLMSKGMLPLMPKICDVSCGPGNMVMDFRRNGFTDTHGCEFSKPAIEIGKEEFGIDIPFGDLRGTLPFDSGMFDFVYCVGVMTMIPLKDVPNACSELSRILKVKGLLHILLINPGSKGPNSGNEPHLTAMPHSDWNTMFIMQSLRDKTADFPPQEFGIGVNKDWDFAKLYQKDI